MVQAMINIDERSNRILNIIKAKYGFKDKSQTLDFVLSDYEANRLEPELRPEFIEKAQSIMRQKAIRVGGMDDFRKRYGLE